MIFGNTTNTTCRFSLKQYNLFYTFQKHEICPFMETVPYVIGKVRIVRWKVLAQSQLILSYIEMLQ